MNSKATPRDESTSKTVLPKDSSTPKPADFDWKSRVKYSESTSRSSLNFLCQITGSERTCQQCYANARE